jgi:transposase
MMTDTKLAELEAQNEQLKKNNAELKVTNDELSAQVKFLTEELLLMRQRLFGASSEKTSKTALDDDRQLSLFNEAEQECDISISVKDTDDEFQEITYKRKKKVGKREIDLSIFPVERVIHEFSDEKQICPNCGKPLTVCGHDVLRRELVRIPAQYKVKEHMQTVYACNDVDCQDAEDKTTMVKASAPLPLIPGSGIASASLVAHIAHQKYTLALPLYRQEQEFKRDNIPLSRQTMANWISYVAFTYLILIYELMKQDLVSRTVAHADETSVQVLHESGKPATSKSYMWIYRTSCDTQRHIVLFEYRPNRKHENPQIFLEGFTGFLHSDGYQAYNNLTDSITVVGCWAHMRRKFTDILKSLPDYNRPNSQAAAGRNFCDKLFELEREFAKLPSCDNFKARYEARLTKTKPIMDEFFSWADSLTGSFRALPKSPLGKALTYALNQRQNLENVLLDGRLEISNNRAERAIKPFAVGRKNWLFSNTENGAKASAIFYSLIETAKESGLSPYKYLEFIFDTAPTLDLFNNPDLAEALLPWNAPLDCRSTNHTKTPVNLAWDET